MYGEPAYHGAYDSREADNSNGMHRSPSAGSWYQGKFGRTSMSNIDEHQPTDETHHAHSMPAPQSIQCAYQGRFGTMPQAKMMEPQHSGRSSAVHKFVTRRPLLIRSMAAQSDTKLDKNTPDSKWKELLSADEYHILRQKGTEPAGTGKYNKFKEEGVYKCGGCGTPLYNSEHKFDSGCGWPAYYDNLPGAVDRHVDNSYGMRRVEITCSNCGGHLGHVFEGEKFGNPIDERHCVNSKSVKFDAKK